MDVLSVHNITKRFGDFVAVNDISFHLEEGEILGILGRNGAGKTTTIQMLLGILTPTSGTISYFGTSLFDHKQEILEHVNFSSTYTNLPWELTVRENLQFISYLYKIPNRKKRIQTVIELFKLEPLIGQQMIELSAGQLTRVNLAKAFINYPKVLLLDEPTASLDPEIASYIREFLLHQQDDYKTSIILTSHNMREVEEVCDRIIFIDEGKILADDTPEHLVQSVSICHISMYIADGLKKLEAYCKEHALVWKLEGRFITVDCEDNKISQFLRDISQVGIVYEQISIAKPELEDYFMAHLKH